MAGSSSSLPWESRTLSCPRRNLTRRSWSWPAGVLFRLRFFGSGSNGSRSVSLSSGSPAGGYE